MAFIQDHMIGDISSSALQQSIIRIAHRLDIEESKAMFILIQYDWKEDDIVADHSCLFKVANVLRRSVPEQPLRSDVGYCSRCASDTRCQILPCEHMVCSLCFEDHVEGLLMAGNLVPSCPAEDCNKYINPSAFMVLSSETRIAHTRNLLEDFISKMNARNPHPHPIDHLRKGLAFVWNNKTSILATGFAGCVAVGAHKLNKWRRDNPRTCDQIGIIIKQLDRGGCPSDVSFWFWFMMKAKFGIGK